jgi:hypothetical protein
MENVKMNNRSYQIDGTELGYALLKAVMADKIFADKFKVVNRLVEANTSLDAVDKNGNGVLHHAVLNNHPRMVALLAKHDADITLKNRDGLTPVQLAAAKKHWGCVRAFALNKRDDNHEACYGSALASAVKADKFDTVKKLLDAGAELNWATGTNKDGNNSHLTKSHEQKSLSTFGLWKQKHLKPSQSNKIDVNPTATPTMKS